MVILVSNSSDKFGLLEFEKKSFSKILSRRSLFAWRYSYFICLLWPWPLTSKINRVHPLTMANMSAKFDKVAHKCQPFGFFCVHKLFSIYVYRDLDLWPLTSKINRVHPLIIVNMSAKFAEEAHNGLVSIAFTTGKVQGRTHGTTGVLPYPPPQHVARDKKGISILVDYSRLWFKQWFSLDMHHPD